MKLRKAFLDANVLFSAAYKPGSRLVELWRLEHTQLFTCAYAVTEALANLPEADQRDRLVRELVPAVELVPTSHDLPKAAQSLLPAKDIPILASAIAAHATHLVTGDAKHFGPLYGKAIGGLVVVRPASFLRG